MPLCIIRLWLENPMTLVMGSVDLKENLKKVISMSILIQGMEMPKDGVYWCEIGVAGEIATITIHGEDRKSFPLVPVQPHGRLGDLDRMLADNEIYYDQLGRPSGVIRTSYMAVKNSIEIAPTIIEAEGKNTDVPAREEGE